MRRPGWPAVSKGAAAGELVTTETMLMADVTDIQRTVRQWKTQNPPTGACATDAELFNVARARRMAVIQDYARTVRGAGEPIIANIAPQAQTCVGS